jgi:E3 ubiquitin-protein ligase UHRF1
VALSGGYEDDVDLGYAFTFTGSGGRALSGTPGNPKNLRTAPQSSDQEFTAMNASLRLSCELKNSVRVIRGYKNHSPFAPEDGYRYDGLYRVEKCWREAGQSGFQVCKVTISHLSLAITVPF